MQPSEKCEELVKLSEGCRLQAYRDAVGVVTCGYGHTGPDITIDTVWTQQQCDEQLSVDIFDAYTQMFKLVKVPLTQGQTDALTDFTLNMGSGRLASSTLLKVLNMGQYAQVPHELYHKDADGTEHGWIYAGGKILPGLVTRRQAEIELWNS